MEIRNDKIDAGKAFDWGKTSADYAKYRDIYPDIFYQKIAGRNLCIKGHKVLDLGTGTGVLPRNMYKFGAELVRIFRKIRFYMQKNFPNKTILIYNT